MAAELGDESLSKRFKLQAAPRTLASSLLDSKAPDLVSQSGWDIDDAEALQDSLASLALVTESGPTPQFLEECISAVRNMFRNMGDGQISISAYDTAWVALVPALDGSGKPQFPRSLEWIVNNQFADGSWGEADLFSAYDRVVNTVACVVALKTWNIGALNVTRGCEFITQNIHKIADEPEDHMPIGFEIVFPAMMEDAKKLGLDLPFDHPITHKILVERERKLKKIPMEVVHKYPSTLLHSLEGLRDLVDWNRLLKLQSKDGSFLCSPSSTACALMYTGDQKCLQYLNNVLEQFDNAVPNVYPVDLFEHMWIVDRLQRLGIAHYFQKEIKVCLDYVYQNWAANGIAWAREAVISDVDDTAMGFRLLRQHGYDVSSDVFLPFHKDDEFFCFAGQSGQAVTGMFNLHRASQTLLPGESLLKSARGFTRSFLEEKWRTNDISDKWIITKDLPGEVEYALTYPFYASLPRVETRAYLDHYGSDDIWIGKSLYKMPYVHNETFLALAKADYQLRQQQYREELEQLFSWSLEHDFEKVSVSKEKVVEDFFSAAANIYEPQLSSARRVWAQSGVLTSILDDYFHTNTGIEELRQFQAAVDSWDPSLIDSENQRQSIIFKGLYNSINAMAAEAFVTQGRDITQHLIGHYKSWIQASLLELEWTEADTVPQWPEYIRNAESAIGLERVMLPAMFFVGDELSDEVLGGDEFKALTQNVNAVGRLLQDIHAHKQGEPTVAQRGNSVAIHIRNHPEKTEEEVVEYLRNTIDANMQELTYATTTSQRSNGSHAYKKLFFHMARLMHFFYRDDAGFTPIPPMEHAKRLLFTPLS
uniref:Ent-copalyl diphosphate synthase n=1 Tax=Phaeoceros carolinianus TaxID=185665 RepID=A0A8U0D6M1_9EMBR|nr:ent-copalyl diphosphate synthase [Phaeoceros carolinianus]